MYRILIVDDEYLIRQSVQKKLEKSPISFSEIAQASTVDEALGLEREQPFDVIICDIRLGKDNGLDFLSAVRAQNSKAAFIILSGHSEFSYAKTAISLGATGYLLKPINTADFYTALEQAVAQVSTQYKQNLTNRLVTKHRIQQQFQEEFIQEKRNKTFDLQKYIPAYQPNQDFIICFTVYLPNPLAKEFSTLQDFFDNKQSMIDATHYIACKIDKKRFSSFFILPAANQSHSLLQFNHFAEKISEHFFEQGIFRFTIGVSAPAQDVYTAYHQTLTCIDQRIFHEENNCIYYTHLNTTNATYTLPNARLSYYHLLLQNHDYKSVSKFYTELLTELSSIDGLQYFYVQMLYNTLKNEMLNLFPDILQDRPFILVIHWFDSLYDMMEYLKKQFLYIVEHVSEGQSKNWLLITLHAIKQSIETNYAENLSLEDFAKQNHVSSSFLSNQFSQQFGISYQDYLAQIRLEHAQEMLKSNQYTINEISQLCGFSNQHYFSKVFKKKTGQTPTEYKQNKL